MNLDRLLVRLGLWTALLVAGTAGCEGQSSGGGDSETHFLGTCDGSGCAEGLECICGVCTRACNDDDGCSDLASDAQCTDACQAPGSPERICGRPGFGGSAGSTGSGGSAGNSSGGGSAGSAGSSSTSACLADPVAVTGAPDPSELGADVIALAAVVMGACNPDDGVDRNAEHLWNSDLRPLAVHRRWALQAECLAGARCGCAALQHCLGLVREATTDCAPGCDGDVATVCENGWRAGIDCSKLGLTCHPELYCVDRPPAACDEATTQPSCNDVGEVEFCDSGLLQYGPVCEDFGLTCVDGQCVAAGEACTNDNPAEPGEVVLEGISCAAGSMEACINGTVGGVDCATRGPGFSCQSVDGIFFCGLASECLPAGRYAPSPSHPPSCDGTTLTFCNAGRLEHIDCLSLGFTGCEIDTSMGRYGCVPGVEL